MLRGGAKVNDIKRWLEDLDLGRYVEAFQANAIDIELLPDLDEADQAIATATDSGSLSAPSER